MPCAALSAVWTWLIGTPSSTSVIATAGWMPTIVACAPRRRIIPTSRAMTRATNESTTDSPLTSSRAARTWVRATSLVISRSMRSTVVSSRSPCNVTSRSRPIRIIGTWSRIGADPLQRQRRADHAQRELERLAQAAAAAQGAQVDAEVHDRLRGLRPYPAQDARRTHQACRLDGLQQVLRHVRVDRRYPADVEDRDLGLFLRDAF